MNVEYHTLEQKLERLKEQIIHLEKVKKEIKSAADLKRDYAKEALVERLFQVALEVVLDIGRIIISIENLPRPQTNDQIFEILERARIIDKRFASRAFGMGRFRNILVHGYMLIDEEKVFDNLQELALFKRFAVFVAQYLERELKA